MIDRYKYLDLLPCTSNELKAMGYKDLPTKQIISSVQSSTYFDYIYFQQSNNELN